MADEPTTYPYGLTLDELAADRVLDEAERCYGSAWTERDRLVAAIGALSHAANEGYGPSTVRWSVALGFLLRDENAYRAAREHREHRRAAAMDALMAKAGR
jgi:hypothetical protein